MSVIQGIKEVQEEDQEYVEKVKGSQKQVKLEERFKSEVQMREKEKVEQIQKQNPDADSKKQFGRQNAIGKEKSEEKSQIWLAQQEIQKLQKEIEKLNSKIKQQDSSQDQISQNILLKQQQIQGQLLDKQSLEDKEKIIQKFKQENMALLAKVSEVEQQKQKAQEQLELIKAQNTLQLEKANSNLKQDELGERIKQLNEQLSNMTFKFEEYKQTKEKEVSQLNLNLSALKTKHSVSEDNKNDIITQNQFMNEKLQKLDSICKQLDAQANGTTASKESIIKMIESQFLQEIADLKEQNQILQQQLKKIKIPSSAEKPKTDEISFNIPQVPGQNGSKIPPPPPVQLLGISIPQAPQLPGMGVPQAPSLPGLGIPQAPQLLGNNVPQAPSLTGLGVPQPPQIPGFGIPQAPSLPGMNIPIAPQLPGIPQAPTLPGIPQAPSLGIPTAPTLPGIPQAPSFGIPSAPQLPGIPQAPSFGIPSAPQLPGMGPPSAPTIPGFGVPTPPLGGIPQVPTLPGFGAPSAPVLSIPGVPPMVPVFPGMGIPQVQQGIKQKKNPGIPMKGVNWSTLKFADIQGSIWEKIKEEEVQVEEDYLKQEFCQKATLQKASNSAQQNPEAQAAKKITFLPMDRQQSVLLILGKIKLKGEQIAELLINCDPNKLTPNLVTSLLASLPNEQEMTSVQAYDGKLENLADAEKYFKALEKVNGYEERLQALKFKNLYSETKEFLDSKVSLLQQFFDQLQNDKRIVIILENALAVGNFMNGTGFKGGAWGFKISNIDKMTEVKSFDGKLNLLMYLINRIEKKEGKEIVQVDEDLKILEECSKTPVSQLISEITDLKRGIKTLEKAIKVQTADENDRIKEQIEPFYISVQPEIQDLETKVKDLEARYKTIADYFCEDPRKVPSDEFAKQILIFKRNCITAKIQFKNLKR